MILLLVFCLIVPLGGIEQNQDWSGVWKIQYFSYIADGWQERNFEMNIDGEINAGGEHVGYWKVEVLKCDYPFEFRLLILKFFQEEFYVLYNFPKEKHTGFGLVFDNNQWAPSPIEIELLRIKKF